ncbi:MAG: MFS transporter [Pseudomonadota bacterium]
MINVLANSDYCKLFGAQLIALLGTGVATVALSLVAYELSGERGGAVLATALMIKMAAYVLAAPLAAAFTSLLSRHHILIFLDLARAGVACALPFVTDIFQIYILIFILQFASGAFTPLFQSAIPDILPDEKDYTKALSLSRIAYDVESLISPMIAGALLLVLSSGSLFFVTSAGFIASAILIFFTVIPKVPKRVEAPFLSHLTQGFLIYSATPRLRSLFCLSVAISAAGAMVIVNTVIFVQSHLGGNETHVILAFTAFGAGSMLAAFALPRFLDHISYRTLMLWATSALPPLLLLCSTVSKLGWVFPLWFVVGFFYSAAQTPSGQLLRQSAHIDGRPSVYSTHFALSHLAWFVSYGLAGWLGLIAGLNAASLGLAAVAALACLAGWRLWPAESVDGEFHTHDDLPGDHAHWHEGKKIGSGHRHPVILDDLHRKWPA